jgi:hypothetical protein
MPKITASLHYIFVKINAIRNYTKQKNIARRRNVKNTLTNTLFKHTPIINGHITHSFYFFNP